MNIKEALEEFNFFNEGDYITKNMSIAKDVVLTAYEKEKELLELASNMLDNIDYDQIPIAIGELKAELEKEKEKNKNAIDFINERKKTVNKDMAEGTRLQVGTFMWQVEELLEILKEE